MAKEKKPKAREKLEKLDMSINLFGEIKSSMKIDEINKLLNKAVDDKKLRDHADLDENK